MKIARECLPRLTAMIKSSVGIAGLDVAYYDGKWIVASNGNGLYATTNHDMMKPHNNVIASNSVTEPCFFYIETAKTGKLAKATEGSPNLKRWREIVKLPENKINKCFGIPEFLTKNDWRESLVAFEMGGRNLVLKGGNLALLAGENWHLIADPSQQNESDQFIICMDSLEAPTKMAMLQGAWSTVTASLQIQEYTKALPVKKATKPKAEPKPEPLPTPEPVPEPKPEPVVVVVEPKPEPVLKKLKLVKDAKDTGKREPPKKWNHLAGVGKMETYWKSKLTDERRLKCCECGHKVASEQEWILATDLPYHDEAPLGTRDSGLYICPNQECSAFQRSSVFDANCWTDEEGIKINLPWAKIRELFDDYDLLDTGIILNPIQACWNAIKYEVLEHFKSDEDDIFRAAMWPEMYYSHKEQVKIFKNASALTLECKKYESN